MLIYVFFFFLFFRAVDTFFVYQYHRGLNPTDARYTDLYNSVYQFSFTGDVIPIYMFSLNGAAAMIIGSLYFNRIVFVKVALIICGLFFVTFLLNYGISKVLFRDVLKTLPFHFVIIGSMDEQGVVSMPSGLMTTFDIVSHYILPFILMLASYIRLKEKEI